MRNILICGGTHGNEWTGVYLIKEYSIELQKKFPQLNQQFLQINPDAFKANRRFIDEDINRVFEFINKNEVHQTLEYKRGEQILAEIKNNQPDWIFDFHTTTSNLGSTIIITQNNTENFKLAAALLKKLPQVKIIFAPDPNKKYLLSQVPKGLMIEIGPIANGIIDSKILLESKLILETLLQLLTENTYLNETQVEYYEEVEDIYYPLTNNEISGIVHPNLQGKDFVLLSKGDKVFLNFDGSEISYQSEEQSFPIFINEAAYYPTKLAFTLCRKTVKQI